VLVIHNLSRETRTVPLASEANVTVVLKQSKQGVTLDAGKISLPPYASAILQ
jgi:hypothetical protein